MIYNLVAQGGIQPSGTKTINITSNGTTTEDVTAFANAQVIANVPNTYTASDEGMVVDNGALVSQGSSTYTANGIYNTTTIGTVEVSINTAPTLQSKAVAFTPAENVLTSSVTADVGYDGLNEVDITVNAIPSTYVGTGIPQRTSLNVAGSTVTASSGYYASSVSANVAAGTAATPATTITANPTIAINASGLITATAASTSNITPTVTAGYITGGTAGTVTVTGTKTSQLSTQSGVTVTPTTASQTAVASGRWTTGSVIVAPIPSAYLIPTGTSNITANANGINIASYASVNVNVPNSYSAADEGKVVNGGGLIAQGSSTYTANGIYNTVSIGTIEVSINTAPTLQSKTETYTPAETVITDTITADPGYDGLNRVDVRVNAISSTYVGTGIARKSSADLTASGSVITAPAGYYSSGASKAIAGGTAFTPATTITVNPGITVNAAGLITATNTGSSNITPTVTAGYVSSGTAGTVSVTGTKTSQLTTQAAATITPSTASQLAVASGRYTTGSVYVGPIPSTYIEPTGTSNITANSAGIDIASYASVNVNVPNSYSAADEGKVVSGSALVAQTTSTYTANGGYNTTTISSITINVQPALQSKSVSFTPASTVQTSSVTPGTGYYGLSKVDITVDAIPSAYIIPTGTSTINITANGTTTHDVSAFASAQIVTNVPNSYSAADEGKVVSGATLVGQTSSTVTSNSTYDTTLINSLTVNVSGGGGGGDNKSVEAKLIMHTINGSYENSVATEIGSYAFFSATYLSHVNFPNVTSIRSYAFQGCTGLRTVSFPNVTRIGGAAFSSCTYLQSAVFPNVIGVTASAFYNCQRMSYAEFPKLDGTTIATFYGCSSLASARFPMCQTFASSTFYGCNRLATLIVGESAGTSTIVSIYGSVFNRCYNLLSLYLLASFMYTLQNANAFTSTPISTYTTSTGGTHGSIFVKSSLYTSYIAATNWTTYSARIVSLTDAQVANVIANGTHVI